MKKTDQSLLEQMRITDFEISSRKALFSILDTDEIAAHGHKGLCGFVLRGSEWAIHKTGSGLAFIDI